MTTLLELTLPPIRSTLLSVVLLLTSQSIEAAGQQKPADTAQPLNRGAFSLSLNGSQHSLKSGDGDHLLGTAVTVGLGYSYIADNWIAGGELGFITGPFQSSKQQDLTVDFTGTGINGYIGFSAENKNLRSFQGGYGFLLGVSYFDSIGRSVGERVSETDGVIINNWLMRVNNFSIYPAVFFTWLKDARLKGNSPELLVTRIEGYMLSMGLAVPIQTEYRVQFEADEVKQSSEGELNGYSILVHFTVLFGA